MKRFQRRDRIEERSSLSHDIKGYECVTDGQTLVMMVASAPGRGAGGSLNDEARPDVDSRELEASIPHNSSII